MLTGKARLGARLLCASGLLPAIALPVLWGGRIALDAAVRTPLPTLLTLAMMVLACWCLNAYRLRLVLQALGARVGWVRSLGMLLALEFGISTFPANCGGVVVWTALARRLGLRGARGTAAYALEQAVDLGFFVVAVPAALAAAIWLGGPRLPLPLATVQLAGLMVGAVLLALLMRYWRVLPRALVRLSQRAPRRWRPALRGWCLRVLATLRRLGGAPCRLWLLLGAATVHWAVRYSLLYVVMAGLGAPVPWTYLFLAQTAALAAAQAVPVPGGGGGVEVAVGLLLLPWADPVQVAAGLLVWRGASYYLYVLGGAVGWVATFGMSAGTAARAGKLLPAPLPEQGSFQLRVPPATENRA